MSDIAVRMTTDGSSRGNPGPGGWAVYLEAFNGKPEPFATKLLSGSIPETTNNLAELEAVYQGLSTLKPSAKYVEICTDSLNVIGWLYGWNRKIKEPDPAKKFKAGKKPACRSGCPALTWYGSGGQPAKSPPGMSRSCDGPCRLLHPTTGYQCPRHACPDYAG